jgi:hypothetical protein
MDGGLSLKAIVLENDEVWSLWGESRSDGYYVGGLIQGQGLSNNGTFAASSLKDFGVDPAMPLALTATYVPGKKIDGKFSASGYEDANFSLSNVATSTYDYAARASLTDVAGAWSMQMVDASSIADVSLIVSASGAVTGSTAGCSFTGTVKPRASGKNVFDVTATFGASPCKMPGQSIHGIALTESLGVSTRQLIVSAVDSARSYGVVLFGARSVGGSRSVQGSGNLLR